MVRPKACPECGVGKRYVNKPEGCRTWSTCGHVEIVTAPVVSTSTEMIERMVEDPNYIPFKPVKGEEEDMARLDDLERRLDKAEAENRVLIQYLKLWQVIVVHGPLSNSIGKLWFDPLQEALDALPTE